MDLAAAFYLSVYGLAALSGGILAWAEQTPSLTALTPPIAVAALLLNERFRLLRIDGFWIAAVGLIAFIYPTYEFFNGREEVRLLAGAHLLTILQWVLMFYNKSAHQYWWICALSCLQIALAALLTSSPLFGLLILIYMFLALWTLSVFTLLLARLRYGRAHESDTPPSDWIWPQLPEGELVSGRPISKLGAATTSSEFRNAFQGNAHEADLNWRFVFGVCGLSTAALFLGMIFFLLTPRLWMGAGNPFQDSNLIGSTPVTGFSEKVQLRDFGRILESSAPVLELSLFDDETNQLLPLHEYLARIGQTEPLLRGSVLALYQDGEWYPSQAGQSGRFGTSAMVFGKRSTQRYIRQTIRLEPNASRTVFSLVDPEYGRVDDQAGEIRVFHDTRTLHIQIHSGGIRGAVRYHLMAPDRTGDPNPPRYQITPEAKPFPPRTRGPGERAMDRFHRGERGRSVYLRTPQDMEIPVTHAIAQRLLGRAREKTAPNQPTQTQIAETVVTFLRDSGEYQYSLDQTRIDPKLDPIEDFLKNRKTGHCQYFATSLALLLRALGIPSRVITGFKGGVETPELGILEVQQRHAHAWVEAKLNDVWVTLDATPSVARDESVAAVGERVRWYHSVVSTAGTLWSDYVVNLSFTKQQRDLYAPITAFATMITAQFANLSKLPFLQRLWMNPTEWFSVMGGITAFFLMLGVVGISYPVRHLWRLARQFSLGADGKSRRKTYFEFYERFLTLVKPLGLVPKPHQTQLEFAQQVEAAWKSRELPPELRSLAEDISITFYRLRFGSEVLSLDQEKAIHSRLTQLEQQLHPKP
jgi:transglutaminase-like putative cysteine protease